MGYDLECNDALSRVRHAHLATLLPLQKQLSVLNTRFPETLEDYNAMDNNHDMQLKVARFLTAPPNRQDAIMSEYGWAYRQVQPLQNIFKADVSGLVDSRSRPKPLIKVSRRILGMKSNNLPRKMSPAIPGNAQCEDRALFVGWSRAYVWQRFKSNQ